MSVGRGSEKAWTSSIKPWRRPRVTDALAMEAEGIGSRVVRGPDWKWGRQDGGEGHDASHIK